jgi:N-acetylmuramoyl-L-alanine amidase
MLHIYLSPSNQPWNLYTSLPTNEKQEMEAVAKLVQQGLSKYRDIRVTMATLSKPPTQRDEEAKAMGARVYLALHSDAGPTTASGATGFFHAQSQTSRLLATQLVTAVQAVKPIKSNRSLAVRDGGAFGEIREPFNKGLTPVLLECGFHTHPQEGRWLMENKGVLAQAIVRGIVATFQLQPNTTPVPAPQPIPAKGFLVRINTAVLNYRSGPGVGYKINGQVKGGEVYTIVEMAGSWGRLKSGAGWLNINYTKRL